MPGEIGIHPSSVQVDSLFNYHVHWWCSHIVQFNWARGFLDTSVPIAEEDGDNGDIYDFNEYQLNRGPLELNVRAKYGAITSARACVFMACIVGEVLCEIESISVNGKMNRDKILRQAPWLLGMLADGIEYKIIVRRAKTLYPHLAKRLQHAFIGPAIDHRIPQLSLMFELLERARTPHNTWETAKAQVANMTGDGKMYKAEIEHMATFLSGNLDLRGIMIEYIFGAVVQHYVHAAHARRVAGNFWKAIADLKGPATADSARLPFLAAALLSAQFACGETYIQQGGLCTQLQPRHVQDIMRDKVTAFMWDQQLETAVCITRDPNLPSREYTNRLRECIGKLFIKAGRIAANVHRELDSSSQHQFPYGPEHSTGLPLATIDGVCWEFVNVANFYRVSGTRAFDNPFKCERSGLVDEPIPLLTELRPSAVAREVTDVTPIEIGCYVQHTDGTTWYVAEATAGTEWSGGPDGRLVPQQVLPNGLIDPHESRSCSEAELSEYHKVASKSDNLGADATLSEAWQLALGTSTIVRALRMGMHRYPHPNTRIESLPCPKVISCADYPKGELQMIYASARVEPVDSWNEATDVVCRILGVENNWGVVDGYRYKIVPMSNPLFKCDVWHMNTTPDDALVNMEQQQVLVRVTSWIEDASRPGLDPLLFESQSIVSHVCIPMLRNTRDVKAGDRLFCKSTTIGVPSNHDTGNAPRATLDVSSEYAVPISRTAAAHRLNPAGGKRRRTQ